MVEVDLPKLARLIGDEVKRVGLRTLSRSLRVAAPSIMNWKAECVRPSMENIEKIATYFQKDVSWFFTGVSEVKRSDPPPDPEAERLWDLIVQLAALSDDAIDEVTGYVEWKLAEARKKGDRHGAISSKPLGKYRGRDIKRKTQGNEKPTYSNIEGSVGYRPYLLTTFNGSL